MSDKRLKEMNRSLKVKSITDKLHSSGIVLDKVIDKLNRGSIAKRKAGLKSGGRAGKQHGGQAETWDKRSGKGMGAIKRRPRRSAGPSAGRPKAGRLLGAGKGIGKKKKPTIILSDSGIKIGTVGHKDPEGLKDAKSVKGKPHSSPEGRFFSKLRTSPLVVKFNKGGRAGKQHGGRTNLYEELGRVEAEPSNRNRRAEISRVHRELNKGYKSGGAVLKGKKVGIQIK
jgi:hypothetical protein